jgi:hypothetical protein
VSPRSRELLQLEAVKGSLQRATGLVLLENAAGTWTASCLDDHWVLFQNVEVYVLDTVVAELAAMTGALVPDRLCCQHQGAVGMPVIQPCWSHTPIAA